MEGELGTNQIVVTTERGKRDYPWAMQDLRGTISFSNSTITVQLQHPSYPDGVHMKGYMAYFLNGRYQIVNE